MRPHSTPLDDLLAALDNAGYLASAHAARIRRDGAPAIDRFLAEAAAHVRCVKALMNTTAVLRAAARYDLAQNCHDWARSPSEQIRARTAPSIDQVLGRALQRRQEVLQRVQERSNQRQLAAVRGATRGGS